MNQIKKIKQIKKLGFKEYTPNKDIFQKNKTMDSP